MESFIRKVEELLAKYSLSVVDRRGTEFLVTKVHPLDGLIKFDENLENECDVYNIHIPIPRLDGFIQYGTYRMPNTCMGMLHRTVEHGDKLHPVEVAYLFHRRGEAALDVLNPIRGGWKLRYLRPVRSRRGGTRNASGVMHFGSGRNSVDDGWYCRLSDLILIELERGLIIDERRSQRPGFIGYSTTNGSLLNILGKYSEFSTQRKSEADYYLKDSVHYNVPYPREDVSQFVDLSVVPQDVKATIRAALIYGTKIAPDGSLYNNKNYKVARLNTGIPFLNLVNARRITVARARYQALGMAKKELPLVRAQKERTIPGANMLTLRSEMAPEDSFIISESAAKRLLSVEEIELSYVVPRNTTINMSANPIPEDEAKLSLQLGTMRENKIERNGVLFTYHRLRGHVENLEDGINADRQLMQVRTTVGLTPTRVEVEDTYSRMPAQVVKIKGLRTTQLKVGSKLMDRYGNKGTVCKILPDQQMPKVYEDEDLVPVDMVYSPKIWKRKIGAAVKFEGMLGMASRKLDTEIVFDSDWSQWNLEEVLEQVKGLPRLHTVVHMDGTQEKAPVGVHYVHHLNHDPKSKFKVGMHRVETNGCRLTLVDKLHYERLGMRNLEGDYRRAREVALALGMEIDTSGKVPKPVPTEDTPSEVLDITRRMNRVHLKSELHCIPESDLHNTVADPRMWNNPTTYGRIETCQGTIYIPPGLTEPIMGHDNSLVLASELETANAVLAEEMWIRRQRGQRRNTATNEARLRNLINKYQSRLAKRLCGYIRESYYKRVRGIGGVAVANTDLSLDEVGIPEAVYKRYFKHSKLVMVRRHPIHRAYNTLVMKVVPIKDKHVIEINPDTIALEDGDHDGDLIEVIPINMPRGRLKKYMPSSMLKGHTDIGGKKSTEREQISGELGHSQHDIKYYTALSGAIAINISDNVVAAGYGLKQLFELYHFMAQTGLNAKHNSEQERLRMIQQISSAINRGNLNQAVDIAIRFMGWEITDPKEIRKNGIQVGDKYLTKDGARLKGILSKEAPVELGLVRKTIPQSVSDVLGIRISRDDDEELSQIQSADLEISDQIEEGAAT